MNKLLFFDRDAWTEVYAAVSKNKFRTLLTMIGVGWGMFLFVSLLGLTNGMRNGFAASIGKTASNSLFVWASSTTIPYEGYQRGRKLELRTGDIEALRNRFPQIALLAPRNMEFNVIVSNGTQYNDFRISGDYPEQNLIFGKNIIKGRFINADDMKTYAKNCVIGIEVEKEFFKDKSALGELLRIGDANYKVVGVYEKPSSPVETEKDIYIPFTTFQKVYNKGDILMYVCVNIDKDQDIKKFETELKTFLKKRKNVSPDDTQAIGGFNLGNIFSRIGSFTMGMRFLALIVGIVTLFSGVIAIASVLLITVTERTKEFGIRRALGAVPSQIRGQIILESIVLTLTAGLGGIFLASFALYMVNVYIIPNASVEIPIKNAAVDISTLVVALLIMVVMATLAGLLPAQRAIEIKPIDALRDE